MANLFDYLDWRADLKFSAVPFCEVDDLVLSKIVCLDYTGIVPAPQQSGTVTLRRLAQLYGELHGDEPKKQGVLIPTELWPFIKKAAQSARFGDCELFAYVNSIDSQRESQFSALSCKLPDRSLFITFRGTDDTLAGWKENCNMGFMSAVPAQVEALAYLQQVAAHNHMKIRLGGHSKGGNLSVYAAMHCPPRLQRRIISVFNGDGPGFERDAVDSQGYERIKQRIHTVLPQSSLVGMLLEREEDYTVVASDGHGVFQHNALTWQILGDHFVRLPHTSGTSRYFDAAMKGWANDIDYAERELFFNTLFSVLESTGARTLTDLTTGRLRKAQEMVKAYRSLDEKTRSIMLETIQKLLRESARALPATVRRGSRGAQGKTKQ